MAPRTWFKFQNAADEPSVVDIHIIDVIGSWDDDWIARNFGYDMGVTARSFIDQLAALPADVKNIRLHINSPGGDVQAGVNIANALREQQVSKGRNVETIIDGMAASIASVIAMAGSKVSIADNALVMVHNPWSYAIGNSAEMRKVADILDTMRGQIVATYKWHSEMSDEEIVALMDAETWMDADTAIANGFATDKVEGLQAAASIDRRALAKFTVPEKFRARVDAFLRPTPTAPVAAGAADVIKAVAAAGLPTTLAAELVDAALPMDAVTARIATEKAAKDAATARASEITAACGLAKLPKLAAGYIAGAMSVAAVKEHLTTITAELDRVEIDGGLQPENGSKAKPRISVADVYAKRNQRV